MARSTCEPDGATALHPARPRRGLSEKEIAAELGISPHTVHDYAKALHRHFGVQSRGELLALCLGQSPSGSAL